MHNMHKKKKNNFKVICIKKKNSTQLHNDRGQHTNNMF